MANALGQPIYWAGERTGDRYELTRTRDGRLYVRYLPRGVAVGSRHPYLTVATYPAPNAYAATSGAAAAKGSVRLPVGPNAVAFYGKDHPTSVYEAFKGSGFQIEVYSPSARQARQLVVGGLISAAVDGHSAKTATALSSGAERASPAQIRATEAKLGRPVYWAGQQPGTTYELTQMPDGRVYVRYLPPGVKPGSSRPYFTVATYPMKNAFAATTNAAHRAGAVSIPVRGGVAFYSSARPDNVYVAFKGASAQIEVYDPASAHLHRLVAAGVIKPV
jgi:hypothetical protein